MLASFFWKQIEILCERFAPLGIFSLLRICVWLWRCSFAAVLKNIYAETEGDWFGIEVSEG